MWGGVVDGVWGGVGDFFSPNRYILKYSIRVPVFFQLLGSNKVYSKYK